METLKSPGNMTPEARLRHLRTRRLAKGPTQIPELQEDSRNDTRTIPKVASSVLSSRRAAPPTSWHERALFHLSTMQGHVACISHYVHNQHVQALPAVGTGEEGSHLLSSHSCIVLKMNRRASSREICRMDPILTAVCNRNSIMFLKSRLRPEASRIAASQVLRGLRVPRVMGKSAHIFGRADETQTYVR